MMNKKKILTEADKIRISELYNNSDLTPSVIAESLGFSTRTIRRYKNYQGLTDTDSESEISDISEERVSVSKKDQWECKRCGFITDKKLKYCHNCGCGPFASFFTKVGSPEHIPYIPPENKQEITSNDDKTIDYSSNYWHCKDCDYISNTEFTECPECGNQDIIFAPDGIEPKSYPEQLEEENIEPELEDAGENNLDLIKCECWNCGHEFNGPLSKCPKCEEEQDYGIEFRYECSECGYMFNDNPDKCPICGEKFD